MSFIHIRKIQSSDNPKIAQAIRSVFELEGYPLTGTAYADPQLDFMFETYQIPNSVYFVVEQEGVIFGGAGIRPLDNGSDGVCELQKMYFLPQIRGQGIGLQIIQLCLKAANDFGYQKCYLETLPEMIAAQHIYQKMGFDYLCEPLGNTGHTNCPIWMLKSLQ